MDYTTLFVSIILSLLFTLNFRRLMMNKVIETADGYQLSLKTAHKYAEMADEKYTDSFLLYEDLRFSATLLVWATVSLVSYGFPLMFFYSLGIKSFVVVPVLGAIMSSVLTILAFVAIKQRPVDFLKEMTVKTPESLAIHGEYLHNPLISQETIKSYRMIHEQIEDYRAKKEETSYSNIKKLYDDDILELENELKRKQEKVGYPLFTHIIPWGIERVQDMPGESKRVHPDKTTSKDLKTTELVPHHIDRMRTLAESTSLPSEVRGRAERLVKEHEATEKERAKENELAEALLEIETVEKYYEKN